MKMKNMQILLSMQRVKWFVNPIALREGEITTQHDWKIVDLDVKHINKIREVKTQGLNIYA